MFYRRRLFFKIARIAAMFFFGLTVAVFIALSQVNLETLRGDLLNILRNATGLPVEIDGNISWKFSLRPKVELNNIRIPNASWAAKENAVSAKKIYVTMNLLSLLRKSPTIQNVKIYNATIFIEQNDKGEYSISSNGSNIIENGSDKKYPFNIGAGLGSIEVHELTADIAGDKYSINGLSVSRNTGKNSNEYTGWIKSDMRVYPFIVSFAEFNEERKVYPVQVALSTGGESLVANIALEGTSKMPIDFILKGKIPDIVQLGKIFGLHLPKIPAVQINMAGGFDHNSLTLRKSSMVVRGTNIDISGTVDWSAEKTKITAKLKCDKANLKEIFPELYSQNWIRPARPLNVFKDTPLYGKEFLGYDLNLTADFGSLTVYRDLTIKDMSLRANLSNSKMDLNLKAKFAEGDVQTAAEININPDGTLDVRAATLGERVYIGEIMKEVHENNYISELPVNVEFYLQGYGKDLSGLMSTMTGPIYVYSIAGGYAHSDLVAYIYGTDFLTDLRHNIQDLFRSKKKHDQIRISCASMNLKLRDGKIVTENGVAFETNAINLRFAGNVDFGKETMKLSLITVPVRGLKLSITGNLVKSIEISGNLAEPDVKINGAAVASKVASATGIGLLLAPFTGGIGLVAGTGVGLLAGDLLENWLADDAPCKTAMRRGAPEREGDPEWLNKPMAELVGGLIK